ncbi:MAG: Uma2 family endonuclease [Candidatus Kapaibacteriota bacterium]
METAEALPISSVLEEELSEYEIERGKPTPSKVHAATQTNVIIALAKYKRQYKQLTELSLRLLGDELVPDIALYAHDASDWHKSEIEMTLPPLLAIEIVSPSQSIDEMKEKADKYFAAGVHSVWLVLPALAGVMVLDPSEKVRFYSDGEVIDDALGIRIPVDEVFE